MWHKVLINHRLTYTLCVVVCLKLKITRVVTVRSFVIAWTDLISIEHVLAGPSGLRRRSAAARLLRSWIRIPPGAWMFVVIVVFCQVEVTATS